MRGKKRRTNDFVGKRTTKKKLKREDETEPLEAKALPLTVLSEERHYYDDHIKTRLSLKGEEKNPKIVLPKVKITCVPLNVEKIIDLECQNGTLNATEETKSISEKKINKGTPARSRKSKKLGRQGVMDSSENISSIETSKCTFSKARNKMKDIEKTDCANVSPFCSAINGMRDDSSKKNSEILASETPLNCEKQLVLNSSCSKEINLNSWSFQMSSNQNYENLNNNFNEESQEFSDFLPFSGLNKESIFLEINNGNLDGLTPALENMSDETVKIKENENLHENEPIVNDTKTSEPFLNSSKSLYLRCNDLYEPEEEKKDFGNQNQISLQATVENFMNNPQLKCLKETSALKKGLCITWLSNNYVCANQQCFYSHCVRFYFFNNLKFISGLFEELKMPIYMLLLHILLQFHFKILKSKTQAVKLFTKKMKNYPSKFILNIVVSMTNDILFVDVIMAAFKILSARKVPAIWVTFLIYFVFYVTEPSDSRFLKFWANAARFYCQLSNEYTAASGFASLLSVFSKGEKSEEWKIIEFIKLIKQPPIQVSPNYELLQPVLKLDLPPEFLTDAIESCIATQNDVLNVYLCVIPKISIMTSPIQTIELLLKYSKILESMDLNTHADELKRRLLAKVKSFKTKITYDYPLTAAFQEDILLDLTGIDCLDTSVDSKKQSENMPLEAMKIDHKYFQLESDFCNVLVQTLELTCAASSGTVKIQPFLKDKTNETQGGDIGERQISRLQQLFYDCQFDLLGKYLNDLSPNILEQAAEEFLKFLFQMKISLQQGVDLIRIILLQCKSESATKVIASVCITIIINLVRINEWEKAYTIVSLCQEKQVKLIEGKVFYFSEFNTITQCRIALLLIEINAYNGNYQRAMNIIKTNFLFSSNYTAWKLTWKPYDESTRIKIIEDFLQQVISKQLTETMYDLFLSIWKEQKQLNGVFDLRKFVNEVIIILLNEENEEAMTLYEKVRAEVQLNDTTIRAVLVTLVRLNRLSAAKSVISSTTQNVYSFPHVTSGCVTMMISSFWLEEEIYMVFDAFLELLAAKKRTLISNDFENVEINIQISSPNFVSPSKITPLCLGIINPAFKDACNRIQRVFYQFSSPLKLIIMPFYLKVDKYSLQVHLSNRVRLNSRDQ